MAALGVTVQDVETALRTRNTELPSGRIESQTREFSVLAETGLRTPAQFERVIILDSGGVLVRLADIGRAEVGAEDERNIVRVNGRAAVGLGIVKQSTANTLAVAQAVKAELPRLEAALPEGMQLKIGFGSSIFIEKSIDAVYTAMIEAMAQAVAVIFLFPRRAAPADRHGGLRAGGVAAFGLLKSLKSELASEGSTLQYTDQYARQLEGIYQNVPEVNTACVVVTPGLERPNPVNTSLSFVMLKPWEERSRSQMRSPRSSARRCSWACRACSPSRSTRPRSGRASATRRCSSWCRRRAMPSWTRQSKP
jgi:multidrug efflux pump subunit AcrB